MALAAKLSEPELAGNSSLDTCIEMKDKIRIPYPSNVGRPRVRVLAQSDRQVKWDHSWNDFSIAGSSMSKNHATSKILRCRDMLPQLQGLGHKAYALEEFRLNILQRSRCERGCLQSSNSSSRRAGLGMQLQAPGSQHAWEVELERGTPKLPADTLVPACTMNSLPPSTLPCSLIVQA